MRDYDPTTGRYLQADPLGLVDGASVYGYVKGNPGRWIDPRGEEYKPGRTPPGKWPLPPESLTGKKPTRNSEGYWEGKGGKKLSWDGRSHGTGIDRGQGPQEGHWDDGSGSGNRWGPDGTPLPDSPVLNKYETVPFYSTPILSVPSQESMLFNGFAVVLGFCGYMAYSIF